MDTEYGFDKDGKYRTPYEITVFHADDLLGNTVVGLSRLCQSIPMLASADLSQLGQIPEHPSPKALILTRVDRAAVESCIKRGFQTIRILEGCADPADLEGLDVIIFKLDDIYSNTLLETGLGTAMALEHVLGATYPDYELCKAISRESCKMFVRGIRGRNVRKLMYKIANDFCGPELVEKYVKAGEIAHEFENTLADNLLKRGHTKDCNGRKFYIVQGAEHIEAVKRRYSESQDYRLAGCDLIMFVDLAGPATWSLTLLSTGELDPNTVLEGIVGEPVSAAHAVCGTPVALKLI